MPIYDNIEEVSSGRRLPALYENEGNYKLEFMGPLEEQTGKADGVPFWRGTFKVVDYNGPAQVKAGDQMVFISKKNKFNYHVRDMKNLLGAALNAPDSRITKSVTAQFFDPTNDHIAGTQVLATVAPKEDSGILIAKFNTATPDPVGTYDREASTIRSNKDAKTPPPSKGRGKGGASASV
jgi:hypothetical protein